jgi:RNA polymerase sigma-70 factor (sigma-E family)
VDGEFEQWANARSPALLRAAYVLTGHQQAAEDLVQETLERVAISWRRISDHPDAYARQVMYRMEARRWRRRRGRDVVTNAVPDGGGRDLTGDVETRMVVERALRELTGAQRTVIVLRYFEDLSEADTAAVLACTVGTVKSQTYKALRNLRQKAPELADLVGGEHPTDV